MSNINQCLRILSVLIIGYTNIIAACPLSCAKLSTNDTSLTCNKTSLACLHGCVENFEGDRCDRCRRGWIGPQCDIQCDYNCQNCTLKNGKGVCDKCLPGYYNFNKDCVQCRSSCLRLNITEYYTCDQDDGTCLYGCVNNRYGDQCERACSPLCINKTCNRHDGCCTIDYCKYDTYGGCNCQKPCNSNCEEGICFQNETCSHGCKLNTWGQDCSRTCSGNCLHADDNSTSVCNRAGECTFGCKDTYTGSQCMESCSVGCLNNTCDQATGLCLNGCMTGWYGSSCTNTSPNSGDVGHKTYFPLMLIVYILVWMEI